MLWHPHLILVAPGIVGPPDFQSDSEFASGFGDENSFGRVGYFGPGDNHDFFGDALIDQYAITLAHSSAVLSSTPRLHGAKLPLPNSPGKSLFAKAKLRYEERLCRLTGMMAQSGGTRRLSLA